MTNEYKLAPSVPTDDMREEGYSANIGPAGTYQAMLKDAPTLAEVDYYTFASHFSDAHPDSLVQAKRIYESLTKHGKLYAVKEE